jgi:Domain of unknown function (DUF4160)
MPTIVRLQLSVIRMYFKDHNPPHFHVETPQGRAMLRISDFSIIEGQAPARAVKEARLWAEANRGHLEQVWQELHP